MTEHYRVMLNVLKLHKRADRIITDEYNYKNKMGTVPFTEKIQSHNNVLSARANRR